MVRPFLRPPLVAVAGLILAMAAILVPLRANPAVPLAAGCNGPQVGGVMAVFDTCDECLFVGNDGASQGAWYSWRCREVGGLYYLYAT